MKQIDDENFNKEIEKGLTLVDFYADWCGPCRMMAPILEELSKELEGKIDIVKLDVDKSPNTAREYHVMSIPTMILYSDGKPVEQIVGLRSKDAIKNLLSSHIK